jgi:Tfp pilus assembly protein PilX
MTMLYRDFNRQKGATLFVGLMFLLVLTLVALVSMQGTSLELKMATNQAQRQSAFQLSENMRLMTGAITSQNTLNRGMQNFSGSAAAWTGTGTSTVTGEPGGGTGCSQAALPTDLQLYQSESVTSYSTTWHTIGGVFRGNVPTGTTADIAGSPEKILSNCTNNIANGVAWANVFAIGTRPGPGSGNAQNESSTGVGASAGGANKWFEIRSQGQIGNGAAVVTAAEYRQPIVN